MLASLDCKFTLGMTNLHARARTRPRRASARLEAAAEALLPPLLRAFAGDPLSTILNLLGGADLACARLACRDFRDHMSPAQEAIPRSGFLRTRRLALFARERMPGFVLVRWRMLRLAARIGCVGALEKLVDHRQCELTAGACSAAAKNGQLGALTWLRSRGCPWDGDISYCAAKGGHLEVLQYAHEHICLWDSQSCRYAAMGGHLEVLRYAHEHGCPWVWHTCYFAAEGRCRWGIWRPAVLWRWHMGMPKWWSTCAVLSRTYEQLLLSTGSNVDLCIINEDGHKLMRGYDCPNPRKFRYPGGLIYPPGTTPILSTSLKKSAEPVVVAAAATMEVA